MKEKLTVRTKNPLMNELARSVYAHRGFHDNQAVPENSMAAFRKAVYRGWGIELDVHLTLDKKLVVFHDHDLKRMTGEDGILEEKTLEELKRLRLLRSEEEIPLLDDVLSLTEGKVPLIIELKVRGNHRELSEHVSEKMKGYKGRYCIESFHPMAVYDMRKLSPDTVRGQLYMNFFRDKSVKDLPFYQKALLTVLAFDLITKPDFIAYRLEDKKNPFLCAECKRGAGEVAWTIRSITDFVFCLDNGIVPIFEGFDPENRP